MAVRSTGNRAIKNPECPPDYRIIRMRLEVFRVSYLSPAGARVKTLSSAIHKLTNWDETDFMNQCKASFIFGFILSSIFCFMRNQRSLYASSSLKHAMTGLLWGAKASISRIKTNLAAAKDTHDSGTIKTLTHNALDFTTTPWQAQCHQRKTQRTQTHLLHNYACRKNA